MSAPFQLAKIIRSITPATGERVRVADVVAKCLSIQPDGLMFHKQLAFVNSLYDEVAGFTGTYQFATNQSRSSYERRISQTREFFSPACLNSVWNENIARYIAPENVEAFDTIQEIWKFPFDYSPVSEDRLKFIYEHVQRLIELVKAEPIADQLKVIILSHLTEIEFAIRTFAINGEPGLSYFVKQALGDLLIFLEQFKAADNSAPVKDFVSVVATAASLLTDNPALIKTIGGALGTAIASLDKN